MTQARIPALILAGGAARRMGGRPKGALMLGGVRLIDHVLARLSPQVVAVFISGPDDYGTGLETIPDHDDAPAGPVGGIWSAARRFREHLGEDARFLSVPVDAPFLPADLAERLAGAGSAVAEGADGWHPTFAQWRAGDVLAALSAADTRRESWSLHRLARACDARPVRFAAATALMNINRPEDLAAAEAALAGSNRTFREEEADT